MAFMAVGWVLLGEVQKPHFYSARITHLPTSSAEIGATCWSLMQLVNLKMASVVHCQINYLICFFP